MCEIRFGIQYMLNVSFTEEIMLVDTLDGGGWDLLREGFYIWRPRSGVRGDIIDSGMVIDGEREDDIFSIRFVAQRLG